MPHTDPRQDGWHGEQTHCGDGNGEVGRELGLKTPWRYLVTLSTSILSTGDEYRRHPYLGSSDRNGLISVPISAIQPVHALDTS